MSSFILDPRSRVGISFVDEQHAKLIDIMEEIRIASNSGKTRQVMAQVLHDLVEYTRTHFVDEEKLMEENGYPYLAHHKELHSLFVETVTKAVKDYLAGKSMPANTLRVLLYDWLMEHIRNEDKKMAEHIKARNPDIS